MVTTSKFGLIVLAAGLSERMGGPNKLLQPYLGMPLLAHALKAAGGIPFKDRLAVTGRDFAEVGALAASYGFRCVHNPCFNEGMGTSIAAGARAMRALDVEAAFIALGDMPGISAAAYGQLAQAFRRGAIVVPVCDGVRGHPVLFCKSYLPELASLAGHRGARSLLERHAARVAEVKAADPGVLCDVDTPQDFQKTKSLT